MSVCQSRFISISILLLSSSSLYIECSLLVPVYSTKTHIINAFTAIFKSNPVKNIGNINVYGYYDKAVRYQFTDLLSDLVQDLCVETCIIHWQNTVIPQQYEHSNLVLVDTFKSLRYLYKDLIKIGTRNLAYTLVYISSLQDPQHATLKNVFQDFYSGSILNVGIILELSNMDLIMLSYNPFDPNACHIASTFILNTYQWEQQRWFSTNYFPQKTNDFQQCLITCATTINHPYLWISYNSAGKISGYEGLEGKLLEFFGETLNIRFALYMLNESKQMEAYNLTGWIFNEILQTAHFAVGGFYNIPDEWNVLPFSQSDWFYMSSIYFIVTLKRELSSYEKLTLPFSELVWYLTILTLMLGVLVIFVSRFARKEQQNFILGRNNRGPYYKLFTLALGGNYGHHQMPRRNFARFLLMFWLLATLVLRNAYQSGIYQLLSTDKQREPPSSLQELVAQGYSIETHTSNMEIMKYLDKFDKKKLLYFSISPLEKLQRMATLTKARDRKIAMFAAREYYGYFRKLNPLSKQVYVSLFLVNQHLYTKHNVFYVRKNSYLVQVINEQIEKAHSYGFSQKWMRTYVDDRVTGEINNEAGNQDIPLNIQQLQIIFDILLWLLLVSSGVFGLEVIYGRYLSRSRVKITIKIKPR